MMAVEQKYHTNVTAGHSALHQIIDDRRAKSIARRFLEQHRSLIIFKNAILKEKIWTIVMDVGYKEEHIIHVYVDAQTGKILGYR